MPLVLALLFLCAYYALQHFASSLAFDTSVVFGRENSYVLFIVVAALIVLSVRVVDLVLFDVVMARRSRVAAPLLLREILSIALYILLFSAAISTIFGYSIRGVLASATVVAAVVGLALQDTLGNLFAGISLHLERAFEVGDVVRSGELIGIVEGVNWRAARLRTFDNNVVVLPNSALSRERLEVFAKNFPNATVITVGVDYAQEPARVIDVLLGAVRSVEGVVGIPAPIARVMNFGDSSVTYEVKFWILHYDQRDPISAEVRRLVWYALRRAGMVIPFPIRTVIVKRDRTKRSDPIRSDVLQRLRDVDLLAPLSDDELEELAARTTQLSYGGGELILRQGEEGDSMFIVHSGTVAVRISEGGERRELAQLGPGSLFGEMALFTGEKRAADVAAVTDSVVLEIRKESLHPILLDDPGLAARLSEKIVERRSQLRSATATSEAQTSLLGRIRSWFGLR